MSIFGEKISDIERYENTSFESSVNELRSSVSGEGWRTGQVEFGPMLHHALEQILSYYRIWPKWQEKKDVPEDEQLDYLLKPYDLNTRYVDTRTQWYTDCNVPLIGIMQDGSVAALIPYKHQGYRYKDPETGNNKSVRTEEDAKVFVKLTGICRMLPSRPLNRLDLLAFLVNGLKRKQILSFFITSIFFVMTGLFLPILATALQQSPDIMTGPGVVPFIVITIAVYVLPALLIRLALGLSRDRLLSETSNGLARELQSALMARIYTLPVREAGKLNTGDVSKHLMLVEEVVGHLLASVLSLVVTAVFSLMYLIRISSSSVELVAPSIYMLLGMIVINLISAYFLYRVSLESFRSRGIENGMTYSMIRGMKKIHLSGAEKRAFVKWTDAYRQGISIKYNPPVIVRVIQPLTRAALAFGMLTIYLNAFRSGISATEFYSYSIALSLTIGAFTDACTQINALAASLPLFRLLQPVFTAQPEEAESRVTVDHLDGRVGMQNVSFTYEDSDQRILDNISFSIKKNEYVAIVGKSGCGKSTMVRMLLGFETPQKGDVFYNSQPLKTLDLSSVRSRIGIVLQNGSTIKGTIEDNIRLNNRNMTEDDVWEAARIAGIEEDILSMPLGLKTPLQLGGAGLSGGQLQKIMIARAIASKPSILILDEATSALDNISQKQISDALDELSCTRIVIAHRLSTIRHCDRILVMENGRITEEGSYEQLMEQQGLFRDLVEKQLLYE